MKRSRTQCDLKSCLLCQSGDAAWLSVIEANRKTLSIKKGDVIFREGTPVTGVYFIDKGIVKIHQPWRGHKHLVLNFAQRGDMIGYRGLGHEPVFPVTATAITDSTICYVDLPFFESVLRTNHQLTFGLMKLFANALQAAEKRMRNLALMDGKRRVADTLLMLQRKFGVDEMGFISCQLSRQDMAAYAGTTYETFFRMLQELIADGMIDQTGKRIQILALERLESLTQIRVD